MRIHRIHLQHVAGVEDRALEFGEGVTVVVGPNEAGKSTIATALQLLLEEKDRYDNERIRSVRPVHVDADPTIELECSTGPYRVTYRKVFGRTAGRRETSLTVHAPRNESLTGDAAHDRMTEILDETVDEELWAALRVQQRHDVGQADLTASGALAAALDAAGAGAATLAEDGSLVDRVDAAAAEFWTETGRPRKPLQEADDAVGAADAELTAARQTLAGVQDATTRHDGLVEQLAAWRDALPALESRAKTTTEALAQVTRQREALATAERDAEVARSAVTRARDAVADRTMLADRVTSLAAVLTDRTDAVERAEGQAEAAERRVTDARAARDEARTEVAAARRALRAAEADVRLLRMEGDVASLRARIDRATALHEQREDAKARLDDGAPSQATIRRLEALAEDVRTAAAVLEADLPHLRVEGPTGSDVTIDGDPVPFDEGALGRSVDGQVTVRVGEVTVTVTPGASAAELRDAHGDAVHALARALEEAGVPDVAAARARREAAQDARRALEQTDGEWQQLVAVDGLDGLRAALTRTTATVSELRADRPDDRPLPDDVAHAEDLVATAQAEVDAAQATLTTAETALETAVAAAGTARTAAAEAVARRDGLAEQLDEARTRLEEARAATPDETLATAVEEAEARVATAEAALATARTALADLDVATIEADAEAAQARLSSTRQQLQEADLERAQLWGEIEASASAGLGEKVPQLEAALDDATARRDALRHRAEALKLLRETLHRHRDEARARYQAPLRAEIERLGRVVFGEDFTVELDEHLRVVSRTLAGRTLAVEQLSGGAQEQLAIITRLAAASLVDTEDGVPLILDDALGYADPTRTDRVNTLLADVGTSAQVIVLTCDPDRFAGVPGARLVRVA